MGNAISWFGVGQNFAPQRTNPVAPPPPGALPRERLAPLFARLHSLSGCLLHDELDECILGQKYFTEDQPSWADRGELAHLFVLESGFAFKFEILPNGQRHIADFFGPGAICNWSRLSDFEEQDDILFKARSCAILLDPAKLDELFKKRPGIASVFKRHELARAMRTTQRTRALIARNANEKLIFVLLDLFDELAIECAADEWITLPLTQQELADLLGVTSVHISRTFAKLEETGILARDRKSVRLRNPEDLRRHLSYKTYFQTKASN